MKKIVLFLFFVLFSFACHADYLADRREILPKIKDVPEDQMWPILEPYLEKQNGAAYVFAGSLFENATGVERDLKKAVAYYEKAAELGEPMGMVYAGDMYGKGLGVERDFKKAFTYYEMAAKSNYPLGMVAVGDMYAQGWGVEQNFKKAEAYYKQAKESADAELQLQIDERLENLPEFELATKMKDMDRMAALSGDTYAMYLLAADCQQNKDYSCVYKWSGIAAQGWYWNESADKKEFITNMHARSKQFLTDDQIQSLDEEIKSFKPRQ